MLKLWDVMKLICALDTVVTAIKFLNCLNLCFYHKVFGEKYTASEAAVWCVIVLIITSDALVLGYALFIAFF